jgi:hypothetical protein
MGKAKSALDELFVRRLQLWEKLIRMGEVARGSVVVLRQPRRRLSSARLPSRGPKYSRPSPRAPSPSSTRSSACRPPLAITFSEITGVAPE